MKSLFRNFFKRKRLLNCSNSTIDEIFNEPIFTDMTYPIIIDIRIFIIYKDVITKFYTTDFSIIDLYNHDLYENKLLKDIAKHIKNRVYTEHYSYIYHLQNMNRHETIHFLRIGIDNMFQKIYNNVIENEKDCKEYLDMVLFGPSEPFIENIDDVYH